jgi:hypothetical protein
MAGGMVAVGRKLGEGRMMFAVALITGAGLESGDNLVKCPGLLNGAALLNGAGRKLGPNVSQSIGVPTSRAEDCNSFRATR